MDLGYSIHNLRSLLRSIRGRRNGMVLTKIDDELKTLVPFTKVTAVSVVSGSPLVFKMQLEWVDKIAGKDSGKPKAAAPLVVKLDGWPHKRIGKRIFIRIGAQGYGCSLRCMGCDAANLPGQKLKIV